MSFRALSVILWFASTLFTLYGLGGAVIALTGGDASELPLIGSLLGRPHFMDKASPVLILLLFAWVLFELAVKRREVRRQHAAIAKFQTLMAEADQNLYQPKAFDLRQPRAVRRADIIIECSRREPSSLHEAVPAAAALDAGTLAASYGPLNVYAWILPVLGFIGTASGMASSIAGFSDVLNRGGGRVQVETIQSQLSQLVIPGLAAAFETTILALGAALVAYLCTNALRSWDQEALDQLDRLCIVLLSRIPQPPSPDGQKILAVLQQIADEIRSLLHVPADLERAASAIKAAAESLASSSEQSALAASAMREAAEALGKSDGAPISKTGAELSTLEALASTAKNSEALASAIKDFQETAKGLRDAVTAPITITLTREKPQ
jgi:biopolymer transport protein ExbB/TolQ